MDNYYAYDERKVNTNLGSWDIHSTKYKIYGIAVEKHSISEDMMHFAYSYVKNELPKIVEYSDQHNGLGFVIIHSGELGYSVLVHWWEQGSVLCQQVVRKTWNKDTAMNMSARSVVACVWELGLINSEQLIWRNTMMNSSPDSKKYIGTRPEVKYV